MIVEENLIGLLLVFSLALFIQYLLVRRHLTNIADPLVYFVVTSSFSFSLAGFVVDDPWMLPRIILYFTFFYAGFRIAVGRPNESGAPIVVSSDLRRFRIVVMLCCVTYLAANILLWMNSGLIILSDDPTLQKSDAYAGGLGFVRRVNWGIGVFAVMGSIYWLLWERSRRAMLFMLLTISITATGGSKGALLPLIFAIGLYFTKPFAGKTRSIKQPNRRWLLIMAILAVMVPVAVVLLIENDSSEAAVNALLVRMFFFGDVLIYWGQADLRNYFSGFGPLGYLQDTFGSILGVLRLVDYSIPVGNQFVQYSLPAGREFSESLGPNLPFYVRGELYFGWLVAPLHAFVIGWIFGRVRRLFVRYQGTSLLSYSLLAFAVVLSATLPIEEGLAVGKAFDFLVLFVPIYAFASIFNIRTSRRPANVQPSPPSEVTHTTLLAGRTQ